jgi:hypothetical protein
MSVDSADKDCQFFFINDEPAEVNCLPIATEGQRLVAVFAQRCLISGQFSKIFQNVLWLSMPVSSGQTLNLTG